MSANLFLEHNTILVPGSFAPVPPTPPMSVKGLQIQITELKQLVATLTSTIVSGGVTQATSNADPGRLAVRNESADCEFRNVVVSGHIRSSGDKPTAIIGSAATGSTVMIDGTSMAGTIVLTTGNNDLDPPGLPTYPGGVVCTVHLSNPESFTTRPRVMVMLESSVTDGYPAGPLTFIYPVSFTSTPASASFSICHSSNNVCLSPNSTYRWSYMVME